MKEKIEFVRLPALLLLIFFLGKLIMSQLGTPYEVGLQFFSMVTLQVHLCLVWPAVARRYKGCGIWGAVQVGILIALASQILIFFGTGLSYLIGDTHFNYPAALNQEGPVGFVAAMQRRRLFRNYYDQRNLTKEYLHVSIWANLRGKRGGDAY